MPRPLGLPLWQHPDHYARRPGAARHTCRGADGVLRALHAPHRGRGIRPRVCPLARHTGTGAGIRDDDVHRPDHRGMPAHGRHRAGNIAAHHPADDRHLFTYRFRGIIGLSIAIGCISCLGGLYVSFRWNIPSGASIIFLSILIYMVCKGGKTLASAARHRTTIRKN